ncbi:hypothetical protein C481_09472 [Natrialba asiatica DSM 12278]|uniref:Uncharacterized protein n=1 Tax=Natrialba asiatica (strain ATCC 700177 / DSM 12278 / JCM 9576 / FERM P-10747 / NBRC 102637 / 172P1) TaxID=29540 RepID=M0AWF6_NATA1|nr:hypothetical protein C481_09472 [Natrialba asiatica DSM 12278]
MIERRIKDDRIERLRLKVVSDLRAVKMSTDVSVGIPVITNYLAVVFEFRSTGTRVQNPSLESLLDELSCRSVFERPSREHPGRSVRVAITVRNECRCSR